MSTIIASPATQKHRNSKKLRRKKRKNPHASIDELFDLVEDEEDEEEERIVLLDTFSNLFNNETLSDVHFIVGSENHRVPAHRLILSARSEVFERMLYGPMKEGSSNVDIEVPDLDPSCFLAMLRFVYTAKADLTPETAMGTLYAAKKYGVQGLRFACVKYLRRQLNVKNACMIYSQAQLFDEKELEAQCLEIIQSNAKDVLCSNGFTEMPKECMKTIIESDDMRAKEINIFKGCLCWAESECRRQQMEVNMENKRRVLSDILPLIRFPLLSSEEVAEDVVESGVLTAEELVQLFSYLCAPQGKQPKILFSTKPRIRFLVIGTDWAFEVKQVIASIAAVSVDAINPNVDTIPELAGYDAVLAFSSSAFQDPDELGDALADYVDAGGGVVVAAIASDCDNHGISGRFDRDEYHALKRGDRCHDTRHTLGRRVVPEHPILENVVSFDGGPQSWRVKCTVGSGAKLVAEWEDGVPLVAEKVIRGRPCSVSLNLWPPSRNISKDGWETFTDGDVFIVNALMYVAHA